MTASFRVPAMFALRPEVVQISWPGFCAWLALLAVDAQNEFGGRLPERFCTPVYLAHQFPEFGPRADELAGGLTLCEHAGLVARKGDTIVLCPVVYDQWRAPKSAKVRKREQRARER